MSTESSTGNGSPTKPGTHRVEALSGKQRGRRAEVSAEKPDVVGPLLPPSQVPGRPPAAVVLDGSPVVVVPDLHAENAAFRANCEQERISHTSQ